MTQTYHTDLTSALADIRSRTDPGWILRTGGLIARWVPPPPTHGARPAPAQGILRDLLHAAQDQAETASKLAPHAVRQDLESIIMSPGIHAGLQWLYDTRFLDIWIPELAATVNFSQEAGRRHKDVWEHTKQVVFQAVERPPVRWAALLHDIGKVRTRTFTPDGGVHFHRHSEVGARMFDEIGQRMNFDRQEQETLRFLILHHLRANQYVESWTDSAVRRFDREMDGHLTDLLDLSRADITSRRPGKRQAALQSIDALSSRIDHLRKESSVLPVLPSGIGNDIMERFHLKPSRLIGDLKRSLEEAVERGELEAQREAEYYFTYVEKQLTEMPSAPCRCHE